MPKIATLPNLPENSLISILIPNYNYAGYLKQAIESCIRQHYKNIEIVVCDDGSTDNSREILEQFSSEEKITIIRKENGGQSSALNKAFQTCKGEIITFLDSDDYYFPEKISEVIETFQKNPKSGFLVHSLKKQGEMVKITVYCL